MTDPQHLLQQFIEEDRAGGTADPLAYLARVDGGDRTELEALLDGYLARAPRRAFDEQAYAASPAARAAEAINRTLVGESGRWPTLLPQLRHQAQLKRAELVERLAAALGVAGQEEKVAVYYHEMELGTLPADGVSDRVLASLASIVGATAAALRQAGSNMGEAVVDAMMDPGSPAPAFARVAEPNPDFTPAAGGFADDPGAEPVLDEVDLLFTGGA